MSLRAAANHSRRGQELPPDAVGGEVRGTRLTPWQALSQMGWLTALLAGAGGLAIANIVNQPPFKAHAFALPVLTGWGSFLAFGLSIELCIAQVVWQQRRWRTSTLILMAGGLSNLASSGASSLLMVASSWSAQGLIAASPTALFSMSIGTMGALYCLIAPKPQGRSNGGASALGEAGDALGATFIVTAATGGLAFVMGAGLSLIPGVGVRAGILVQLGGAAFIGAAIFYLGLRTGVREYCRAGIAILGGFALAGLMSLASWAAASI